jgi:23S rRNA (uracil1939-C5)-methyltransferase
MKIRCLGLRKMNIPMTEPKTDVRYFLPGEEAELTSPKKVIEENDLIIKSPKRQKVICPIFHTCGGCDFLHIVYDEQIKMKEKYLSDLFKSLQYQPKITVLSNPKPLHYRHKVVLSATMVKTQLRLGLYRDQSKEVIPFLSCYLHDEQTNQILKTIEDALNQYKIKAYDVETKQGIFKHVFIRKSFHDHTLMVVLVTQGHILPHVKDIIAQIREKHPQVTTIMQNIHRKNTRLVLLEEEKILYGSGFIFDRIDDLQFRLSARSFYQINPLQMMKLYQHAIELLNISTRDIIFDTYSGIGTLSLLAAQKAKQVIAIESNVKAHQDALANRKMNQIDNVTFVHDDVEGFMMHYQGSVDGLIMDPTREGASPRFLNAVMKLRPKRIVYISCEPETQVRDLAQLAKFYKIEHVMGVDMFSNTVHVESITLLSLK